VKVSKKPCGRREIGGRKVERKTYLHNPETGQTQSVAISWSESLSLQPTHQDTPTT